MIVARIAFYCNDSRNNIEAFEYYKQDIDALRKIGHEVIICNKYREIPFTFDVLFVWWWTYALYPVLLARIFHKPVIVTGTYNFKFPPNFDGVDYFSRPVWQRILIKLATVLATLNLFVNRSELKGCSDYFGLRNARYFPHIIDEDYLEGPFEFRLPTLFNLAWSGKKNLIRKGIPELLQAISLLKTSNQVVKLKLAGHEGDGTEYLKGLIQLYDIESSVEWLGPLSREEKIKLLRTCEVYVQPSHYEGFGLAMAEAMGCGACVITCDVGAVSSVVGECGIYVRPGAPEELAEAIKKVLYDDKLRHDLQDSAHIRAKKCFSMKSKIEKLKDYLSEIGIH